MSFLVLWGLREKKHFEHEKTVCSLRLKWIFFFFYTCDLSMKKFRKCVWQRRVLTCISVAVVIGVYWCSTIYLNMIKKEYMITIYHTFVVCPFIFSDLQKNKFKKRQSAYHLSQCYIRIMYIFVPSAGSYDCSGTWLFVCNDLSDWTM